MAKRALLIGIDNYTQFEHLPFCVIETGKMKQFLDINGDNSKNFDCKQI